MIIVNEHRTLINEKEIIAMDKDKQENNIDFYFKNTVEISVPYNSLEERDSWYDKIVRYLSEK